MSKYSCVGVMLLTIVSGGFWLIVHAEDPAPAAKKSAPKEKQTEKEKSVRVLMRKKLAAAQDILEGLTTEDFEMVQQGAKLLKSMAHNADFQISKDAMYIQHSKEFQNLAEKLEKAAKDNNLDRASLHYVNLTMNCIECHRFVRDILLADATGR